MDLQKYSGGPNPFSVLQDALSKRNGGGGYLQQKMNYETSMAMINQHHNNLIEVTDRQHSHALNEIDRKGETDVGLVKEQGRNNRQGMKLGQKHETAMATLRHGHVMDFAKETTRGAQPETGINVNYGDVSASFTKKAPVKRAVKTEAPAPVETAAEEKPAGGPTTGRDPKTGRAVSLKKK